VLLIASIIRINFVVEINHNVIARTYFWSGKTSGFYKTPSLCKQCTDSQCVALRMNTLNSEAVGGVVEPASRCCFHFYHWKFSNTALVFPCSVHEARYNLNIP